MATRSELAREELVKVVGEHASMLRVLGERTKAVLGRNALFSIADAYKRYALALEQDQRRPPRVR